MGKNTKYKIEQIKFVDNLLTIYNINGLTDYKNELSQTDITDNMIDKINNKMNDFKKYFPTKGFNLQRKNYKIDSPGLALSFIKNLIIHIGIRFDIIRKNNKTSMCLKPLDKILYQYIEQKISDKSKKVTSDYKIQNQLLTIEEEFPTLISNNRLDISFISCIIKRIKLLNLSNKYTYNLYVNGHRCCKSAVLKYKEMYKFI